ncbi:uncharacterized protein EDB93DRAFT_1108212 [Suillus bovinus]|uniref:uncharacterized protein n=1 Tax=Suillus bovinus TaxID=48563 RepID=UPI001B869284|nr:uncharacterized protein EDB93DRAFT_1108212 [Suillus bovinus]KAG2130988.1 hypothetical protein EDB93DRAFT_1108212 [Suillus bovinus]
MIAAYSKLTEENWHPSSLLAYNALLGHQDFDSIISDAKPTVDIRTDSYDRSLTSRSCLCIIAVIATLATRGILGVTKVLHLGDTEFNPFPMQGETFTLIFNVTLCTESISFVHNISFSALASESRLRFSTNLRLLTAARGWYKPSSALLNGISAVLIIISYSSPSLIIWPDYQPTSESVAITGFPLLILGVALLLQVIIALSGMRAAKILTWSSSPFDLTAALVHHTQLTPAASWCMRRVSDLDEGPAKPPEIQPSAWHAHPSIRKVVISLWIIVAAYAGWAALVIINLNLEAEVWILLFANVAVIQGPLTLGLHCSELIENPFLHWMFGLSFAISDYAYGGKLQHLAIFMFPAQTLANLVDERSPVMWWGHKEDGTSDHPLPDVKMDCVYAGSGAGSMVPFS